MTLVHRSIVIGLVALALVACDSDQQPQQTSTDTASTSIATLDTHAGAFIAIPADTLMPSSASANPALVDTGRAGLPAPTKSKDLPTKTKPPDAQLPVTTTRKDTTPTLPVRPAEPTPPKTPDPVPTPTPTPALTETADNTTSNPKVIFRREKCNACHTVTAAGVTGDGKNDLSNVGTRRTHDWIMRFLNKKEMINGEKHKKTWKASQEDLDIIVRWLSGLK